jgi:hypothetical protein
MRHFSTSTSFNGPSRIVTRRPGATYSVRYIWWRAHHGLPSHPRWLSVARKAQVPVSVAFSIVLWLLDAASRGKPRGSIADFSLAACAAYLNIEDGEVERVIAALQETGWIAGQQLITWDERQPQREDDGAADRKRAQRERQAASKACVTNDHAPSRSDPASSGIDKERDIESSSDSSGSLATRQISSAQGKNKRPNEMTRDELDATYIVRRGIT